MSAGLCYRENYIPFLTLDWNRHSSLQEYHSWQSLWRKPSILLHCKSHILSRWMKNNILIDARGVPYLADYELTGVYQVQHLPESVRWTAPERFGSHDVGGTSYPPTTKSDVYSLGGLMYQVRSLFLRTHCLTIVAPDPYWPTTILRYQKHT